jgi:hypothetical protein
VNVFGGEPAAGFMQCLKEGFGGEYGMMGTSGGIVSVYIIITEINNDAIESISDPRCETGPEFTVGLGKDV